MTASALFQINVGAGYQTAGVAQNASPSATINCKLASVAGVDSVEWEIFGTHGVTAPAKAESGSPPGQITTFTLPAGLGQAYGIRCKVNGGTGAENGDTKTSAVFVLDAGGNRPAFLGETFESDAIYGIVIRFNAALSGAAMPAVSDTTAGKAVAITGANRFFMSSAAGTSAAWSAQALPGLGSVGAPTYSFVGDTNTGFWSPTADAVALALGGVEQLRFTANVIAWEKGVTSPVIWQATKTADEQPQNFTIRTQNPFSSATGANRVPGSLLVDIAAPTNGGTTEGFLTVQRGGSSKLSFGYAASAPITGAAGGLMASIGGPLLIQTPTGQSIVLDCGQGTPQPLYTRCQYWAFYPDAFNLAFTLTPHAATPSFTFAAATTPTINSAVSASGAGRTMTIEAQGGAANTAGGTLALKGGAGNGTGAYGDVSITGRVKHQTATKAMADADQTLSTSDAGADVIITTGANTADRTLTMGPAVAGLVFHVDNRCTGAFGVTFKCATGTGIKVGNVRGAILYCDGTNVYRLSADTITTV